MQMMHFAALKENLACQFITANSYKLLVPHFLKPANKDSGGTGPREQKCAMFQKAEGSFQADTEVKFQSLQLETCARGYRQTARRTESI